MYSIFADAARKEESGESGIGWVLVSHGDKVIKAGSLYVGITSSVELEKGQAILCAIQNCREQIRVASVYSDAQVLNQCN
ncbi:hypothetical protein Sjap_020033 [Stephania japonica]|uniref:RNase H type-1 domain-containing protein n=1 Tax=Stephania japonica TaxID=461633 RepID=A0AAP0I0C8_9MAGN